MVKKKKRFSCHQETAGLCPPPPHTHTKKKALYVHEEKCSVSFLFVCLRFAVSKVEACPSFFFLLSFNYFNYFLFVNNGCQFYRNKTKQERGVREHERKSC